MATRLIEFKGRSRVVLAFGTLLLTACRHPVKDAENSDRSRSAVAKDSHSTAPRDFVVRLQQELKKKDREIILDLTHFPVQVGEAKEYLKQDGSFAIRHMTLLDEASFRLQYDAVWNLQTTNAVLEQNPDLIGQVADQFVIGCGEVWFSDIWRGKDRKDGQYRITVFDMSQDEIAGISLQDCYRARDFVRRLQSALASDDRKLVVTMLKYPLEYHGLQRSLILHNPEEALHNYDVVFSAKLREVVAKEKINELLPDERQGIIVGEGFVSINEPWEGGPFKVISIAEPTE